MRLEFHSQIASDISRIMEYYEDVSGIQLSDEFYSELRVFFQQAARFPPRLSHCSARPETGRW